VVLVVGWQLDIGEGRPKLNRYLFTESELSEAGPPLRKWIVHQLRVIIEVVNSTSQSTNGSAKYTDDGSDWQ
jgi:hypothetical protein